ncbi:MAG: AzlC family ABC transporter permease [Prevotella sp.]|nr:AzlC family ABC transporter permease [Prevotella sp.]
MNTKTSSFRQALPMTLPVMAGYWFLGITYGMLAHSMGFSVWYPLSMALLIYSGSAEFLALGMLLGAFNPMAAMTVALVVGARHLFYGLSMLDRYKGTGWRKPFLIFWLTDETFAVNYNARNASPAVMLWVSLLDYLYWSSGAVIGYLFGSLITIDLRGLEFVVTAMFATIFIDQYLKEREHRPAWVGLGCTALCLWLVGSEYFILPSMLSILVVLTVMWGKLEVERP